MLLSLCGIGRPSTASGLWGRLSSPGRCIMRFMSATLFPAAVSWFALAALAAPPPAVNPSKAGMDPERLARIPARMKAFVEKGTIPGSVTLIQRHGALASLEVVGYQDLESKKPLRADTIFQIMSMTKPVTAAGLMILMEEGRLGLADPVEKHLPEFKNLWLIDRRDGDQARSLKRPARAITIRDLLTHTSGLYGGFSVPTSTYPELVRRPLAEIVAMGSQLPLEFEPGTKWLYSNIGIAALGRIIEVAADQPFERFMEARIFRPLGMNDTYFFPPAEKYDRVSMAYNLVDNKLTPMGADTLGGGDMRLRKGAKNPIPEGGMFSTATDMAAFYQMMLNGGTYNGKRLLARGTVDQMTELHTGELQANQPGMGYGLAWAVAKDPMGSLVLPLTSIGSYGHGGAYGTYGWVDPKKDLVGVFLVQRPGATEERNAFMSLTGAAVLD